MVFQPFPLLLGRSQRQDRGSVKAGREQDAGRMRAEWRQESVLLGALRTIPGLTSNLGIVIEGLSSIIASYVPPAAPSPIG
jgi:hypothetical protein